MGDIEGLVEKVSELGLEDNEELVKRLKQGRFHFGELLATTCSRPIYVARHVRTIPEHFEHGSIPTNYGSI
jgi:hypothetical protein